MLQITMHIITDLHDLCFQTFVKKKKDGAEEADNE